MPHHLPGGNPPGAAACCQCRIAEMWLRAPRPFLRQDVAADASPALAPRPFLHGRGGRAYKTLRLFPKGATGSLLGLLKNPFGRRADYMSLLHKPFGSTADSPRTGPQAG